MTLEEEIFQQIELWVVKEGKLRYHLNIPNRIFSLQSMLKNPNYKTSSLNDAYIVEAIVHQVAKKYDKVIRLTSPFKMVRELEIND